MKISATGPRARAVPVRVNNDGRLTLRPDAGWEKGRFPVAFQCIEMKLNVISFYWAAKGTRNRKKWQDFPFSVPFSAICQSCTAVNSRSLLLALKRPATQSGGLEGILPGVAALPLRGVSFVWTDLSRSWGRWPSAAGAPRHQLPPIAASPLVQSA